MSVHWGSNATGMLKLFLLYLLARRGCALFPTVCKTAGAPDRLRVIYFLIRAIIQLYCPGQSLGNIASNIFISESDRGQFSSSPVINVTPHPYSHSREEDYFTSMYIRYKFKLSLIKNKKDFIFCPGPGVLTSLSPLIGPRPRTVSDCRNLWENADRDNERLFVNGAFCINQLTVGRGQQKLRKAMEISSKMSSKGRKSWM